MGKKTRTLLDIDSPTHKQLKRAIDRHLYNGTLFVPDDLEQQLQDERKRKCGGCGRSKQNRQVKIYFGEEFCADCVEKWQAGYK